MTQKAAGVAEALAQEDRRAAVTQGELWSAYREVLFRWTKAEDRTVLDRVLAALHISKPAGPRPEDGEDLRRLREALRIDDAAHEANVAAVASFVHLTRERKAGAAFYVDEIARLEPLLDAAFQAEADVRQKRILAQGALDQAHADHVVSLRAEGRLEHLRERHPQLFPAVIAGRT